METKTIQEEAGIEKSAKRSPNTTCHQTKFKRRRSSFELLAIEVTRDDDETSSDEAESAEVEAVQSSPADVDVASPRKITTVPHHRRNSYLIKRLSERFTDKAKKIKSIRNTGTAPSSKNVTFSIAANASDDYPNKIPLNVAGNGLEEQSPSSEEKEKGALGIEQVPIEEIPSATCVLESKKETN